MVALAARRIELEVDDGDDSVTTLRERRGHTISQLLRSVGRLLVVAIALLLTFNVFIDIGPILAGAGILGLAVSFGAQSLVKDFLSGFFILFENQFAIGDVIEAGGKSGTVEKMTLRVVVLRDLRGTMHVVPNSEIKVVSNMTRGWSRAVVDVGIAYEEDIDRALAVVRDEAAQFSTDKVGCPARRPARSARDGVAGRQRGGDSDPAQDPARLAVGRGAGIPPPAQEAAGREGISDPVPAAAGPRQVQGGPASPEVAATGGAAGG